MSTATTKQNKENIGMNNNYRTGKLAIFASNYNLTIGTTIVFVMLIIALFPNLFTSYDPAALDSKSMLLPPSAQHWFGTDNYGRDVFARVIYATRLDLFIGIVAVLVPFTIGSILGLYSGYYGGKIDTIVMRLVDVFMSIPYMVLCIMIVAIIGAGIKSLLIAMWVVSWKNYARLIRSEVLVIKNVDFIEAAKTMGYSDTRIIYRHILPNVLSSAIVYAASDVVVCMMASAGLSFLGIGVQPPTPEWGAIIAEGKSSLTKAWWQTTFPGLFLITSGLGFSLLGDGLSDLLRTKGR
jgi:peptide/nickel transport system permease protein